MNTSALVYFAMSAGLGLIAWFTIFATIIWPKVKGWSKKDLLKMLTAIHFFRYMATSMLILGLVVHKLPAGFVNPAAFGDLVSLALAYVAFIALQRSAHSNGRLLSVWIFNIVGTADLLLAAVLGPILIKDIGDFGFTYFIPTLYVPALFAAHFYAFKTLVSRDKN